MKPQDSDSVRAAINWAYDQLAEKIFKLHKENSELRQSLETAKKKTLCKHGLPGTCVSCRQVFSTPKPSETDVVAADEYAAHDTSDISIAAYRAYLAGCAKVRGETNIQIADIKREWQLADHEATQCGKRIAHLESLLDLAEVAIEALMTTQKENGLGLLGSTFMGPATLAKIKAGRGKVENPSPKSKNDQDDGERSK